ncbi:aspartate/glutamate racemase family protein [Actinobacillus vicugnae]|uniref:aspartate/glutamate racemase family protein n=1 Tax=Actinobacillus vicugnae TaxID=2573093 RepID=UPI001241E326|nr:aspartate/glutamate racemase family protein [Actinobacillus vicugnae]
MNTLGIIGGMSPASTTTYYDQINQIVNQAKGGNTTAPVIVYSVEFGEIVACQKSGDWQKAAEILGNAAQKLEQIGAKAVLIATNTMHKVADEVQRAVNIPLIHIIDTTATAIKQQGLSKVALLGTAFVIQQDFYKDGLAKRGVQAVVPNEADQAEIHRIIFDELCVGKVLPESKAFFLSVIEKLQQQGIEGVILGCTEIGLLIQQADSSLPFFDTAELHAKAAAEFVLGVDN